MKWQITLNKKNLIVSLPDRIPEGIPFNAKVGDKEECLIWHPSRRTLAIVRDGVENNLHFRSLQKSKFAGDPTTSLQSSLWRGSSLMTYLSSAAEPYVPGSENRAAAKAAAGHNIRSQITGKILSVSVKKDDSVSAGDTLLVIEAMKMENKIFAPADGKISKVSAKAGSNVSVGEELIKMD